MNIIINRHVKILIMTVLVWLTVHREKYTIQKLNLLKPMMTSDFILDHFVLNLAPVSYCML